MKNYHNNCAKLSVFLTTLAIASFNLQLQASDYANKQQPWISSIECKDLDLSSVIICDSVQIQSIDHIKKQKHITNDVCKMVIETAGYKAINKVLESTLQEIKKESVKP